ncbi:hypothetical protein SeLEV6574_g03553 [Synchytrium endobioticum]|uniref:Uncharacterized protein n=1 Tax=Synchytrium endobioticum TaxID=286115 RepID=A0A507D3N0_9FUNG|nr:hypothetical protein SeLEV6574_g03553 [Synchytrium endobioticum]
MVTVTILGLAKLTTGQCPKLSVATKPNLKRSAMTDDENNEIKPKNTVKSVTPITEKIKGKHIPQSIMLVTARAKNGNDETDLDGKKLQLRYNDRFINLTLRKRKSKEKLKIIFSHPKLNLKNTPPPSAGNMAATESERMREEETVVNDAGPTTEKNVPEVNPGDSTDDGVEGLPKPTTPLRRCLRMKKGKPVDSNALEQGGTQTSCRPRNSRPLATD